MKKKKDKKHKDSHKEIVVVADPQPNLTIDQILNMNKASTTHVSRVEVPLPPEFPPAPVVGEFLAKTEDEYKEYMKRKFLREQWDNAVILFRMKQKNNDKEGMRQVMERISLQLKDLPVDEADSRRSTASETSAINTGEIAHNLDTTEADLDKLFKELKEENNRSENNENPSNEPSSTTVVLPPPTTHQSYVAPSPPLPNRSIATTGKEPESNTHNNDSSKEESGEEDDESSWKYKWYRSTLYNTFFSRSRRRIIFVPIQVLFLIMIIISTAVSNIAAGILCGLVGGLFTAGLAGWIIWSFRNHSKGMPWVIGFLVAEGIAELFSIIGGFAKNGNFIFYLGIPGIVIVIAATVLAYIGIIKDALEENSRKSEMV